MLIVCMCEREREREREREKDRVCVREYYTFCIPFDAEQAAGEW